MTVFDDFLGRAVVAGLGVAVLTGPLGCFIVWRRLAYFGDAMAHSALLGIAAGLALHIEPFLGVGAVTLAVALLLVVLLHRQSWLSGDALLGIFAHAALSLGLVGVSLVPGVRTDLTAYLFGDILAIDSGDVLTIYLGGAAVLAVLTAIWRPLLALTVHPELARAEGRRVLPVQLTFMVLIAAVVALAMKVVGALLITSLLIIPAAAARRRAGSPEQMAVLAALIGMVAVAAGLGGSLAADTPAGPSIVVAAALIFAVGLLLPMRQSVASRRTVGPGEA